MDTLSLPAALRAQAAAMVADLRDVFGARLTAVVAYGRSLDHAQAAARPPLNALALVDVVKFADLVRCAEHAARWDRSGLAMPLLLAGDEFARSLDVFPFEYGDILARHVVLEGADPFAGLRVPAGDLRRACESAAKGHLIHLREGYLEARGRAGDVARLVAASAPAFATLLGQVARLQGIDVEGPGALAGAVETATGASARVVGDVLALLVSPVLSNDEAGRLFPAYLAAVEQLVAYVDRWNE